MTIEIAKNQKVLTKRMRRFFENVPDERRPAASFVSSLSGIADVFVFGGLIRDLGLYGTRKFRSDVDLVVRVHDRVKFEDFLSKYSCSKNKFGGYRIKNSRWLFDLWEFEKTWAFSNGLVEPKDEAALLKTTFFNWDAIFYDAGKRKLVYEDGYFENITSRHLDVNLKDNPNNYGSFVRALRMVIRNNASTSAELTEFIIRNFEFSLDDEILAYESHHFDHVYLKRDQLKKMRSLSKTFSGQKKFNWPDVKKDAEQQELAL